jgi:tRNA pseudouridine55 synthase
MKESPLSNNYTETGEVILLDKDLFWTSFNVVHKVKIVLCKKYQLKKLKVGHAGTLDPLATGLMIICTGKQTKNISHYQESEKEYIATIKLGETTPSFDLETGTDQTFPFEHISRQNVLDLLEGLKGEQDQIPPVFSAVSLEGKRAYEYARKGKDIELKPRKIIFHELELLDFNLPFIKVKIVCSKGTYIRSFARDVGIALKSGGTLVELRRTRIGTFSVNNALTIKQFELKTNAVK